MTTHSEVAESSTASGTIDSALLNLNLLQLEDDGEGLYL